LGEIFPIVAQESAVEQILLYAKMKVFVLFAASAGLALFWSGTNLAAEAKKKTTTASDLARPKVVAGRQAKLLATRMMLIDRKKHLREQLKNSMTLQENRIRDQSADYELKKELFKKNLITKNELENSERALSNTRLETERIREWIAEDDRALSLAEEAAEAEADGFPKHMALIRYDGTASWSLTGVGEISRFFRERFGRALPISTMGQSDTHDRMGLDHRDAVDVALRPDSTEGRDLIAYLRRAGIPFIAFRGKITSMSTGAHIHIGHPSPRLTAVNHFPKRAEKQDSMGERS
jgi:hypothetical protein